MGNEDSSSVTDLVEKTKTRVHRILTAYPGASMTTISVGTRVYNPNGYRRIFENMLADGEIRREAVEYNGAILYRFYTNHPIGEVRVITPSIS